MEADIDDEGDSIPDIPRRSWLVFFFEWASVAGDASWSRYWEEDFANAFPDFVLMLHWTKLLFTDPGWGGARSTFWCLPRQTPPP